MSQWAATSRPAWRLTARPALENQGTDAMGALGICRRKPLSSAVGLKNYHRPMKMLDMCLWAVVRRNSLILLLIHNKSQKNLPNLFSTRPEMVSLRWGVGWRTLCFEAVSETPARRGGWTEAEGVGGPGRMEPQPQKPPFSNKGALPPPFPPGHAASRATLQLPRAETWIYFSKKKKNPSVQRLTTSLQHDVLLVLWLVL